MVYVIPALLIGFLSGMYVLRYFTNKRMAKVYIETADALTKATQQFAAQNNELAQQITAHATNVTLILDLMQRHNDDLELTTEEVMRIEMLKHYYTGSSDLTIN